LPLWDLAVIIASSHEEDYSMFETDLHAWLQSFNAPWVLALMRAITFMGYDWIYPLIVIGACFGGRLRPALTVTLSLLLASVAIHGGKDYFELPRPSDVDARLMDGGRLHQTLFPGGSARDAWSLPEPGAVAALRATKGPDYGFPSGHVGATVAGWLCLCLAFGWRRRTWAVALAWGVAMAISRMYLGRHFLADVLGGLAIGLWAAAAATVVMRPGRLPVRAIAFASIVACLVLFRTDLVDIAKVAGLAVAIAWFEWRGYPVERSGWASTIGRLTVGVAGFECLRWGATFVALPKFIVAALVTAAMFPCVVNLAARLRLYESPPES